MTPADQTKTKQDQTSKPFVIARTVDVPRARLWKAWTDTEQLKKWWGPKGAEVLKAKLDLRPGGTFHYCMRYNGQEMWGKFVYREIVPNERFVFVSSFSDEKGGVTRHPMSDSWPIQMLTTITFTEQDGKTTITVQWAPIDPTEAERKTFDSGHDSMRIGWTGTFDQLTEYLKKP